MSFTSATLETSTYREVQAIAKEHGLKANRKRDELVAELLMLLSARSGGAYAPRTSEDADDEDDGDDGASATEEDENEDTEEPSEPASAALDDALAGAIGSLKLKTPASEAAKDIAAIAASTFQSSNSWLHRPAESASYSEDHLDYEPDVEDELEEDEEEEDPTAARFLDKEAAVSSPAAAGKLPPAAAVAAPAADDVLMAEATAAEDSARLDMLVAETWYLTFSAGNRVHCALTAHDVPAVYSSVQAHLAGRKVQRLLQEGPLRPKEITELAPQRVVPVGGGSLALVCLVTGRELRPTRKAVAAHLASKERAVALAAEAAADKRLAGKENHLHLLAFAAKDKPRSPMPVKKPAAAAGAADDNSSGDEKVASALLRLKGMPTPCGTRVVFGDSSQEQEAPSLRAEDICWTYDEAERRDAASAAAAGNASYGTK